MAVDGALRDHRRVTDREEFARAVEDPRFPPAGYFVAFGVVLAVGIGLLAVQPFLVFLAPVGLLVVELVRRRNGRVVRGLLQLITMNAPLPGTMVPTMAATVVAVAGGFSALSVAASSAPDWICAVVGVIAGTAAALLARRSERYSLAAIRRLEREAGIDTG